MNATVNSIRGSSWRTRKGGSIKLLIELRPSTQAEWVEALETFKGKPEVSVVVTPPKLPSQHVPHNLKVLPKSEWCAVCMLASGTRMLAELGDEHKQEQITAGIDPATIVEPANEQEGIKTLDTRYDRQTDTGYADPALATENCHCGLVAGHTGECIKPKRSKVK